ncbi:hypothetical protein [Mycobacterium sp.]|uniref:hypothetical protein n=1 Tax=Mycobacterium sp. TaxID=1785 RepID=UPI003F9836D0
METNNKAAILALDADLVLHSASKAYGFDANWSSTCRGSVDTHATGHNVRIFADVLGLVVPACWLP